jgi:hypothetical protein
VALVVDGREQDFGDAGLDGTLYYLVAVIIEFLGVDV